MSMTVERRMYQLLESSSLNEVEVQVIDRLIEALSTGKVQPIA